jgi:hypothetical protein
MGYDASQILELLRYNAKVRGELQDLMLRNVMEGEALSDQGAREYLHRGVGRRLNVIHLAMSQIYDLFPPSRLQPLPKAALNEVQVYLHAFVINLSGIFDCWAWAFVLRHGLLSSVGGPRDVGMFLQKTQRYLPAALQSYVATDPIKSWHEKYVKSFRDALAHRIPLYIPPSAYTTDDARRFNELDRQKMDFLRAGNADEAHRVMDEQEELGTAALVFMQELTSDPAAKPVLFHPQVNSDAATVVEFGNKFYDHWSATSAANRG